MINLVIPLIFRSDDQRQFFYRGQGFQCIAHAVEISNTVSLKNRIHIVTDDLLGLSIADKFGIKKSLLNTNDYPLTGSCFPYEIEAAMLWSQDHFDSDSIILILNPCNPMLSSDMIDKAVIKFKSSRYSLMLSAVVPEDHPVQFQQFLQVVGLERIFFIDTDWKFKHYIPVSTEFISTKAFPFNWERVLKGKADRCDYYQLLSGKPFVEYIPTNDFENNRLIWQYLDEETSRILIPLSLFPWISATEIVGISLSYHKAIPEIRITKTNRHWEFFPLKDASADSVIKCTMLGSKESYEPSRSYSIQTSLIIPQPRKEQFGMLCQYFQPANSGVFNLSVPFLPNDNVWYSNSEFQPPNRSDTNTEIFGRQNFMDVYEIDGSFLIAKKDSLDNISSYVKHGHFDPFILSSQNSLHVETMFDILKYYSILEGIESN